MVLEQLTNLRVIGTTETGEKVLFFDNDTVHHELVGFILKGIAEYYGVSLDQFMKDMRLKI